MPHPVPADIRYHIGKAVVEASERRDESVPAWVWRAIDTSLANALAEKDRENGPPANLEPLRGH